jgi:hypothetical protein
MARFDVRSSRQRLLRAGVTSLAVAGVGAAAALAAGAPAGAVTTTHQSTARQATASHATSHTARHHVHHFEVRGLAAGHHGRTVTVFAKTVKVGAKTRHNQRLTVTFAQGVPGRTKIQTGDRIHLTGRGVASLHHVTVRHNEHETVSSAPATLFVGTVKQINGSLLLVSENDRDNGDGGRGHDQDGHGPGHGGDDAVAGSKRPSDDGPGDGDNEGDGHRITIDDSKASIVVDGAAGALAVGDEVAVLGEVNDGAVVAATVYGFTTPQSFLRGEITSITGDTVTIKHHGDQVQVSLTDVPLALNGSSASPGDLAVGDKLLAVGTFDPSTNSITPAVAFAFNGHDNEPCGDNDQGDDNGHDGGEHGGSDG